MVHIVKKILRGYEYLYLQKSFHIKGTKKKKTKHIAYLGRAEKYTKKDIENILFVANNGTKRELMNLIKSYRGRKR